MAFSSLLLKTAVKDDALLVHKLLASNAMHFYVV